MARFAYAVLWWLALPFIVLRLAWRSRKQPGYLEHLGERFGSYAPVADVPRIWIHAVSVGETRAAAPLVEALQARHPDHRILLTHMTPTGRATSVELFGDRVDRAWLPYDYGFATRSFFAHFRPSSGVILETELWPRLLESAVRANVPVKLANARLSEQSARGYARFASLTRWALANLGGIAAQSRTDADRFVALGAAAPVVTGNIKFDLDVPEAMRTLGARFRASFGPARRVIVAGSTRDGEEVLLLDAFAAASAAPEALLVIVPRHPQRFDEVAALATARGLAIARRSAEGGVASGTRVVIGDSMGEMLAYYAAADVVIMGGSLLDFGSQNLIEACAMGKPVVVGPSTFNFEEASKSAIAAGAALRQRDANDAMKAALALLHDDAKRARMGEAAQAFANANRGALARLMGWL
ncbi:lipid IV(A) 3-deoxy-D-manno-octulosonic acid transferase [Usitatibacter palustris]|uniref:3-deoxy-D-manno-octulosonic acid transferase n=1 Tax=Usitatibacter palustris TaxID=2732487 RepID=A0A6M4H457_9PROT|nr:lipid IV(A) 3-deoxy-D-manno-octulosonic acid transferase [Usitatibacter palustris]QJR13274.1 3-deoxy-D-manno-octulosonic acid transferase [Usitatibacter palustris]